MGPVSLKIVIEKEKVSSRCAEVRRSLKQQHLKERKASVKHFVSKTYTNIATMSEDNKDHGHLYFS